MSVHLESTYDDLRDEYRKITSAFAVLKRAIYEDDPTIAGEVAAIFESYACSVLDRHPKRTDGEVQP